MSALPQVKPFLLIRYQLQLLYSPFYLVVLLISAVFAVMIAQQPQQRTWLSFYSLAEPLAPLLASFFFVPLILREKQQRMVAIIGPAKIFLQRLFPIRALLMFVFWALVMAILGLGLHTAPVDDSDLWEDFAERDSVWPTALGGPHSVGAVMYTLIPPMVMLAGIGLAVGHITANSQVAYMVIFVVWMISQTATNMVEHPILRNFYLFARSILWINPDGQHNWVSIKFFQFFFGMACFAISHIALSRTERFLKEG
jgi:hypothetical protein